MFDGFTLEQIVLPDASLRVRHGGTGPPLLLLHGHPRTHATWHKVAPLLAQHFTVVCPDLPGFGKSSIPADAPDHANSSKRAKACDCVDLMAHLGFDRFSLVGHDRGAYTAFRMAMDHPGVVERLVILDGVPILEALERCDAKFAEKWWHWFFFRQPDKPERAILQGPLAWYGATPSQMGAEPFEDYRQAVTNPDVVHGMIEDYRAGTALDWRHDLADRAAGGTLQCPVLALWARQDDLEDLYGDVLAVWRPWAPDLRGRGLESGHHMAEEIPEELASEIRAFCLQPR